MHPVQAAGRETQPPQETWRTTQWTIASKAEARIALLLLAFGSHNYNTSQGPEQRNAIALLPVVQRSKHLRAALFAAKQYPSECAALIQL
jgi:hypothetical protein